MGNTLHFGRLGARSRPVAFRLILFVKQAYEMAMEINFVALSAIGLSPTSSPTKARPIKRSRPRHLMWPRLRTRLVCHALG